MLKVTQVSKFYYPHIGGVERVVYDLAHALSSQVEMNILACNNQFYLYREKKNQVNTIKVPSIGTCFSMPVSPVFPYWLKKNHSDILHFHSPFPLGDFSYYLSKPEGRLIVTWHSDIVKQKKTLVFLKPFIFHLLEKAETIITTSPNIIKSSNILKNYSNKCTVIPLGVDESRFILTKEREQKAKEIKSRYGKKILLFVGRLVYYKGLSYLLKAMKEVDATLLIVGDGYLKNDLIKETKSLGLEKKIVFIPSVTDDLLVSFYYACDVFVLPSVENSEAFGLVQVEAMMCGKPVVSTNLPTGVSFVNQHKETGLLVTPKKSQELSDALNMLLTEESIRETMGQKARQRALEEFRLDTMAKRYLELYLKYS
mgnify:CR=1 FL=1